MADWTRRRLLVGGGALLAAGCLPKAAPMTAATPLPVALAGVLAGRSERLHGLPEGLERRLVRALEARKLVPQVIGMDTLRAPMGQRRGTPQRLVWLGEHRKGADAIFLVELAAFYDTQIQGRMRWTVRGSLSIAHASEPALALQRSIDTAVFLQFLHQAEAEAAAEAATTIERAAHRLLDDWLRAQG